MIALKRPVLCSESYPQDVDNSVDKFGEKAEDNLQINSQKGWFSIAESPKETYQQENTGG